MNSKTIKFIKLVLVCLITISVIIAISYFGSLLPKSNILKYISCGAFGATVLIALINGGILIYKEINKFNINQEKEVEKLIHYQEEAKNFNKVYTKLRQKIFLSKFYLIVVIALQVLTTICGINQEIITVIFSCVSLIILFDVLFSLLYQLDDNNYELYASKVNKHIYFNLLVDKCLKLMNMTEEVNLIISETEYTNTKKIKDKYYITVYLKDLMLLNEEEFESIIFYELGRIYNGDINIISKLNKSISIFDGFENLYLSFFMKNLLFIPLLNNINKQKNLFIHFTTSQKMLLADEWLLKKNMKQVYVNALAKTTLKNFFQEDRFYLNEYKSEETIPNYYEWYVSRMFREYDRHKEIYVKFLNNYINDPFSDVPTLKERMVKLGVNKYEIDFSYNGNVRYYEELQEIITEFDNIWFDQHNTNWGNAREIKYQLYLNIHNAIKDKDFDKLGLKEQLNYAYAEYRLGDYVTAKECYQKILNKYPNHLFSLKQMGKLNYFINNESCIDYFLKVKQLDVLQTGSVNKYIESYYMYNGLVEETQEQFINSIKELQTEMEINKFASEKGYKVYQENDLPKDVVKDIKLKINGYNFIDKAYLLKKNYLENSYEYELLVITKNNEYSFKDLMKMQLDLKMTVLSYPDYIIEFNVGYDSKKFDKYIEKNEIKNLVE